MQTFCKFIIYLAILYIGWIYIQLLITYGITLDTVLMGFVSALMLGFLWAITSDPIMENVKDRIERM